MDRCRKTGNRIAVRVYNVDNRNVHTVCFRRHAPNRHNTATPCYTKPNWSEHTEHAALK